MFVARGVYQDRNVDSEAVLIARASNLQPTFVVSAQ